MWMSEANIDTFANDKYKMYSSAMIKCSTRYIEHFLNLKRPINILTSTPTTMAQPPAGG